MSEFIYALLKSTGNINKDIIKNDFISEVNVGSRKATSVTQTLDKELVDSLATSVIESIKEPIDQKLQNEYRKALVRIESVRGQAFGLKAYSAEVSEGKIDIDASGVSAKWEFTAFDLDNSIEVQRAVVLLSRAKITAKNYSADWYTENIVRKNKMHFEGVDLHSIHFGATNLYKVLHMVLGALGYNQRIITSLYYASITTDDVDALRHF